MEALGYVECNGLSSATVAADRMLKTSDIKLDRIQNAQNGWITLEFKGDIAALKVAVDAAKQILSEKYITGLVIGSPSKGLNNLGNSGVTDIAPKSFNPEKYNSDGSIKKWAAFGPHNSKKLDSNKKIKQKNSKLNSEKQTAEEESDTKKAQNNNKITCNLCGDPECPRKLGEPHVKCIHYNELKKK